MRIIGLALCLALLEGVSAFGLYRGWGIMENAFKGSVPRDEQGPFSSANPPVPFNRDIGFDFAFGGFITRNLQIYPNGYLHMGEYLLNTAQTHPLTPGDAVPGVAQTGAWWNIVAPLMVTQNAANRFSFRTRDCRSVDGVEYTVMDCDRIRGELIKEQNIPFEDLNDILLDMVIVTWELVSTLSLSPVYVQAVLFKTRNIISQLETSKVALIYDQDGQSFSGNSQYPLIGVRYGNALNDGIRPCVGGVPLQLGDFQLDTIRSRSLETCGSPGVILIRPIRSVFTTELACNNLVVTQDTCRESVVCSIIPADNNNVFPRWEVRLLFRYPTAIDFVHVSPTSGFEIDDANSGCNGRVVDPQGNTVIFSVPVSPFSQLPFTNPCGVTVNPSTGDITGTFKHVQQRMMQRHGDYIGTFFCNVFDISPSTPVSISVGDVGMVQLPAPGLTVMFSLVDRFGPAAQVINPAIPCFPEEVFYLQLKLTRPDLLNAEVAVYGAYGYSCYSYNNDQLLYNGEQLPGVFPDGTQNGLTVTARRDLIIDERGCVPSGRISGDLFYKIRNVSPRLVNDGFVAVTSTATLDYVMQAGPLKCTSYDYTQRVSFQCTVNYCSQAFGNTGRCSRGCDTTRRKRRQTTEPDPAKGDVLTVHFSVAETGDTDKSGHGDECVAGSTAIATIAALIFGLLLASGLTMGAFMKLFRRRGQDKC